MMHAVIALGVLSPLLAGSMPRLEDAQLDMFLTEVYGKRPVERPAEMAFADLYPPETFERNPAKGPKRKIDAKRRIMICRYKGPFGEDSFRFTVFLPKDAQEPVPAYLLICNRNPGRNIDPWREEQTDFWPAEEIVDRGYAAIAFWNDEVAPDCYSSEYAFKAGVFRCFEDPSKPRAADAWGTLSAWAWGASRVMDWIETEPLLDAKRIASVKGVGIFPDGSLVYIYPDGGFKTWTSASLYFISHVDGAYLLNVLKSPDGGYYKVRVWNKNYQ